MSDLERLGDDPRRELSRFEPAPGLIALVAAWPGVVGDEIAGNAWPARIARDGTLHVATSSSTWAFELTHLAGGLVQRLAAALGEGAPKQLRFAPGRLPSPAQDEGRDTTAGPPRAAGAKARSQAASLTASIGNESLREAVSKAAAASLERASDDRSF